MIMNTSNSKKVSSSCFATSIYVFYANLQFYTHNTDKKKKNLMLQ